MQDVAAAAVLSEVVYKAEDVGHEAAEKAARRLEALLPVELDLGSLSWSPVGQRQAYVMAETDDTLYVSFLGTKRPLDILSSLDMKGTATYLSALGPAAKVHKGYVSRAASVPTEQLWRLAVARGRRLVFSGHSMGGAVAHLCALRLLTQLPGHMHSTVSAVGFATPPLGNAAVAAGVATNNWASSLVNYLLPEDWVPGAMTFWQNRSQLTRSRTTINSSTSVQYGLDSAVLTAVADSQGVRPTAAAGAAAVQASRVVERQTDASAGEESSKDATYITMKANWWVCWGYGGNRRNNGPSNGHNGQQSLYNNTYKEHGQTQIIQVAACA